MIDKMNLHYSFTNPASVYDEEALTALELAGRQGAKINEVIDDQNKLRSETETQLNDQDKDIADKFAKQDALIESEFRQQDGKIAANHAELNANFSERFNIMNKRIDEKFTSQDRKIEEYHADIDAKHDSMHYTVSQSFKTQNNKLSNMENVVIPETVAEEVQKHIDSGNFDEQIDESLGGLKERVDNLIGSIVPGASSGDAEIIDARTDFLGGAHTVAGESVRKADKFNLDKIIETSEFVDNQLNKFTESVIPGEFPTSPGYLSKVKSDNGVALNENDSNYQHTDYIDLTINPELYISSIASYKGCIGCLYDSDKNYLTSFGYNDGVSGSDEYLKIIRYDNHKFTLLDALKLDAKSRYVRISTVDVKLQPISIGTPVKRSHEEIHNELKYGYSAYERYTITQSLLTDESCYIHNETGEPVRSNGAWSTRFIPIKEMDYLVNNLNLTVTGAEKNYISLLNYYDKDYNFIGSNSGYKENEILYEKVSPYRIHELPVGCEYIRFSSSGSTYLNIEINKPYTLTDLTNVAVYLKNLVTGKLFTDEEISLLNPLYHKYIVFFGDSFTAGSFSGYVDSEGHTGKDSSELYDTELSMYKTYPYWVGKRTGAYIDNLAIGGSMLSYCYTDNYDEDTGAYIDLDKRSPFVHTMLNEYLLDLQNADYVILSYGLNDIEHSGGVGEPTDPADEIGMTFCSAWNYAFKTLMENCPNLKIGVIIPNGWMNEEYRTATIECCKRWGVPYLDLIGDTSIGTTLSKDGLCEEAKEIKDGLFQVSETNTHPNIEAHKYMSTYVEDFLRRL